METPARIDELYASTLEPRIAALESLRLSLKSHITKAALWVGIPFGIFFFSDFFTFALSGVAAMLVNVASFALIFAGVGIAGFKYLVPGFTAYANYKARFKREVVSEVFKIVCPSGAYSPAQGLAEADFNEPGVFNTRGAFKSDDRVRGVIGQTPFEAAEVRRSYSTGGKNNTTVVVFHGLFFHLDFNKRLGGVTVVEPEGASASQLGTREGLRRVTLENPAFEQEFAVHASDDVEARYILTPAMMDQILALRQRAGKPIFLAFKNNRAYIGVHYGRELFEPGIASSTSLESIHEMAAHFALAEAVVTELDLNTRIWTKGVDASLLDRPDDDPDSPLAEALSSGTLTEADLWKTAASSIDGMFDDGDGAMVARPADAWVQIEPVPGGLVVRYPIGLGVVITFLLSMACAVIGLAALRELPAVVDLGPLSVWLQRIPPIPYATDLVAGSPIPWLIGCWILSGLAMLGWSTRVRRVEVAADGVRIWRGLRPLPRLYPRPPYDRIVRVETSVHVAKGDGFALVNPTASPTLKADEAKWVAAELRRALKTSASAR